MPKYAGLSARDYYPGYSVESTQDALVPDTMEQQAIGGSNEAVTPAANKTHILVWVGVIVAVAVIMHIK